MTITSDPNAIYCMKCKTKTEATNVEQVTLNNGRPGRDRPLRRLREEEASDGSLEVMKWDQPT